MSGTSLDGLDVAICSFPEPGRFVIHAARSFAYDKETRRALRRAHLLPGEDLVRLDLELGYYIGRKIKTLERDSHIHSDLVASHGHTVFHSPEEGYTWQIGHPAGIVHQTGRPVISNFRIQDVASGGEGAPLVPIGDRDLFSQYDTLVNLGGIANLTRLSKKSVRAFDICPCNMLFNSLFKKGRYDNEGALAAKGNTIKKLLKELDALPYLQQSGAKSLAREDVEEDIWPIVERYQDDYSKKDLLRTYSDFIAEQISTELNKHSKHVLVTGGGAYNTFLIENIRRRCAQVEITVPDSELIEFKEALIFAYLGLLRFTNQTNILKEVTNGSKDRSGGTITLP